MGGENAAARHRRDVSHAGQQTGVAQKADQPKVIQARPESATGKSETNLLHRTPMRFSNAEFWRIQLPRRSESVAEFARIQSGPRGGPMEKPRSFLEPSYVAAANGTIRGAFKSVTAASLPSSSICSAVVVANRCMPRAMMPVQPV